MPDFGVDYKDLEAAGVMPTNCEKIGTYVKVSANNNASIIKT